MLKKTFLSAGVLAATVSAAFAVAMLPAEIASSDANGDGMVTYDEITVNAPDLTQDEFNAIDTNTDGAIDQAEVDAAVQAGTVQIKDPSN